MSAIAYNTKVATFSPSLYWRLTETSGTSIADTSGGSRTGTLSGTVTLNQTSLLADDANPSALFAGGTVTSSAFLSNSTGVTVSLLINFTSTTAAADILLLGAIDSSVVGGRALRWLGSASGSFRWSSNTASGSIGQEFGPTPVVGQTYHIVIAQNDTTGTTNAYVDGRLVSSTTLSALPIALSSVTVKAGSSALSAKLDEVVVKSNAVWADADALNLFKSSRGIDESVTNFYAAASSGTVSGDVNGIVNAHSTLAEPADLQWLFNTGLCSPGKTCYLRGGTFSASNGYIFYGTGTDATSTGRITIRNYNGERAILDINGVSTLSSSVFTLGSGSQYTWVWGLEAQNSGGTRISAQSGSNPTDLGRPWGAAFNMVGTGNKLINSIAHDCGNGITDESSAFGTELYGNISYNNGWHGSDRGHGHGIYYQNTSSTIPKYAKENIVFNNFGYGFHFFGTDAQVQNANHLGNISFNGGASESAAGGVPSPNFFITSALPAASMVYDTDISYRTSASQSGDNSQGFYLTGQGTGSSLTLSGIRSYGGRAMDVETFETVNASGMTLYGNGPGGEGVITGTAVSGATPTTATWSCNSNTYYNRVALSGGLTFGYRYGANSFKTFAQWKSATGFDSSSTETLTPPADYVQAPRPNFYEPGRAHFVVLNYSGATSKSVDLSTCGLVNGQSFNIQKAENFFGDAVYSGTYNSASPSITLPLTNTTLAVPNNFTPYSASMVSTLPVFGAFVVLPGEVDASAPGTPTDLTSSRASSTSASLSWTLADSLDTGVVVEKSVDSGANWTSVATTPAHATSRTVTGLTSTGTYRFRIKATNGSGDSIWVVSSDTVLYVRNIYG